MFRGLVGAFLAVLVSVAGTSAVGGLPGESLWIAETTGVHRVSLTDGTVTLTLPEAGGARAVAVDPARTTAWVWTGRTLLALGFDGSHRFALALDLPETVHADLALSIGAGLIFGSTAASGPSPGG